MSTLHSELQSESLSLFQSGEYAQLIEMMKLSPLEFPDKQLPVIQAMPDKKRIGQFGCRVSPTHFALREDDHWVVFTINIGGEMTLNLHGCLPQSVDWVNGTQFEKWIHHTKISQSQADQIVIEALGL